MKHRRKAPAPLASLTALVGMVAAVPAAGAGRGGTQSSGAKVKVGASVSATNPSGGLALPQIKQALQASVTGFNKRGGANGQQMDLDFCDSQGDVNKEAACARQLVSDGVVATLDDYTYNNPDTPLILRQAGIPRIGVNIAANTEEVSSPVSWPLNAGALAAYAAMGKALVKAGHTKFAEVIVQVPTASAVKGLLNP